MIQERGLNRLTVKNIITSVHAKQTEIQNPTRKTENKTKLVLYTKSAKRK